MTRTPRGPAGYAISLVALWAATAVLMWRNHALDPFDPLVQGTARYGHNPEGGLRVGLIAIAIELVLAAAIVRPWSRPAVGRSVVGLLLAAPWAVLSMMMTMHAGGIVAIHFLWTVALSGYCLILIVIAARRG